MKTVNYKGLPIGAIVSQTCVLHGCTAPLWICRTNSGRLVAQRCQKYQLYQFLFEAFFVITI